MNILKIFLLYNNALNTFLLKCICVVNILIFKKNLFHANGDRTHIRCDKFFTVFTGHLICE